jgi:hypothetical protein
MVQVRSRTGSEFEKECEVDGWKRQTKSPKINWTGTGRNNIQKIKSCNFDPSLFKLSENNDLSKYDIYNPELDKYREVKKYKREDLKSWKLYSEPYFKIATKSNQSKMDLTSYNKFVEDFWEYNQSTGLFETIQKGITSFSEGITFVDGFIPKEDLEFRTVIVKNSWAGYHRLTIQFKLKYF